MFGTLFNMIKCIIGAGILTLSFTFSLTGVVLETIILIVVGLLMYYTVLLLLRAANLAETHTCKFFIVIAINLT